MTCGQARMATGFQKTSDGQPGPELEADESGLCGCILFSSV